MREARRAASRRLLLSLIAAVAVCALMLAGHGLNDRVFPADAAVVPGGGLAPGGELAPDLRARLDAAYGLYYYGTVKKILVSGGDGAAGAEGTGNNGAGANEAEAMRDYLAALGVDQADIVLDRAGTDERATVRFTAAYARRHGWERVIAVSQFYHLPRLTLCLREAGLPVVGSLSAGHLSGGDFFALLWEIPAYFAYWAASR